MELLPKVAGNQLGLAKHGHVANNPSRIRGHNFAIMLLQTLEARTPEIVRQFKEHGEKRGRNNYYIDRATFVTIMLRAAEKGPQSRAEDKWLEGFSRSELMQRIGEVFDGADPHNKGKLCFEDLMNYVIDCSLYGEVGLVQEPIPEFLASEGGAFPNLEEITRARFVPELGKLVTAGKTLGVINPTSMQAHCIAPYDVKDKYSCVYDVDYIPHLQAALVVGTDLNIDIIALETGKKIFRIPTTETHSVCTYDRESNLALIGRSSVVESFACFPQRSGDLKFTPSTSFEHHTDLVYRILPMTRNGLVATASADKTAAVTDLNAKAVVARFCGHTSAVHCIQYLPKANMMLSCAFDTEPKLWMLASSRRTDAFTLRDMDHPHVGHVVDLCFADNTPIVATLDVAGTVKIWDIRTMKCKQNIRLANNMTGIFDADKLHWHSLQWDSAHEELVACAQRRIQKVKFKVPRGGEGKGRAPPSKDDVALAAKAKLADEYPIVAIAVNNTNQTVLMCSEKHVRVWDVFSGRQEAAFDKLVPSATTITALCIASNGQTFLLGFRSGAIVQFLYSCGSVLATFITEGPEVSMLNYLEGCQCFAAVTPRGCSIFFDQTTQRNTFFPDYVHGAEAKTVHFDPVLKVFASVGRKGNVNLYESRRGDFTPDGARNCGNIAIGQNEVSCVHVLSGYPVLAVSTNAGTLALYTTTPHPVPSRKFAETLLKSRDLLCMAFYPVKRVLYAADEQGYVHAFNLTAAFESVGICSASNSWTTAVTGVGRTGAPPRETVLLQVAFSVRAHTDIVTGLAWVRGANLLVTSSIDKRVLVWTLGLQLVGDFDPTAERGKFSAPVVVPDGDKYITEAPRDEVILFLNAAEQASSAAEPAGLERGAASFRKFESIRFFPNRRERQSGDAAKSAAAGDDGSLGRTVSAAKFAEDVHRVAMELESFVPSKAQLTKSQRNANRIRTLGSSEPASESLLYGQSCLTVPPGTLPVVESTDLSLTSSNSCGVYCRSLFSVVPLSSAKPKSHVVAEGGGDGGNAFVVTQDHPLPLHFKAERDMILRDLVQQEQLRRQQIEEAKQQHQQSARDDDGVPSLPRDADVIAVTRADGKPKHRSMTLVTRQLPRTSQPRSTTPASTVKPLLPCDLIRLHSSHLPLRAAHESLMTLRSHTPQPVASQERFSEMNIDWTPQPKLSQTMRSGGADASTAVSFCSFGVRSLQSVITSGEKWRNTHRVDLAPLTETPVSRPQSISSLRGYSGPYT